jgi:PKD repeat protein
MQFPMDSFQQVIIGLVVQRIIHLRVLQQIQHPTVNTQTVYTLTVTASNANDTATSTITVTVNPNPNPSITSNSPTLCQNSTITLQSSSANAYKWFIDNSVIAFSNTQSITVNQLGDYKVSTTNTFGCIATSAIFPVTLTPSPVANFTFSTLQRTATFTNTSTNSLFYSWSFGDNSTSRLTNPVKQYMNNGSYNVTLRATNDCGAYNDITKQVSINYCDPNAFETKQTGNWNDLSTWDCGQIPTQTDVVIIKSEHTIYIPIGYSARVKNMILFGRIIYNTNSQLVFEN